MHMADTLLSPAVGGLMWVISASLLVYCSKKIQSRQTTEQEHMSRESMALMGVLGAFIFAAQMINFTIPGTGSSGHLGGALLLAIVLGPYAAFLTIASVLTVQALFFADGGLLALGCNMFNMGFFACFIAYPFIYLPLTQTGTTQPSRVRLFSATVLAAVIGLQLGALAVVLETTLSGISELPFNVFVLLMQPIHLAIGVVEGVITALVALFLYQARPELLRLLPAEPARLSLRAVVGTFAVLACLVGGVLSWYASEHPDGLEWAMEKTAGSAELESPAGVHSSLASIQEKTAIMPDYAFPENPAAMPPSARTSTSAAGLLGGLLTLLLAGGLAFLCKRRAAISKRA